MALISIILSILGALPKLIQLVVEIVQIIRDLKKDPAYTISERMDDETELHAAVKEFKETKNAARLHGLLERVRARRMRRSAPEA